MIRNREIDDEVKKAPDNGLPSSYPHASAPIAAETWLIPDDIHAILNDIFAQLDKLDRSRAMSPSSPA